MLIANIL